MHHFWNIIIEPSLTLLEPKIVVEIGADQGKNTIRLLEFCKNKDTVLHVVDPQPKFDVEALKKQYNNNFVFHRSLSLNAIPLIKVADVFLIDGDHNWYTVFNELKLIEKYTMDAEGQFPVIMLHDIGWPYGRRDLYYDPENIPAKFRKPYKQKGMQPGVPDLLEAGGINSHHNNSIYENDLQNGVLTAIEDFLKETHERIKFLKLFGLYGLGILFPSEFETKKKELPAFLRNFEIGPVFQRYLQVVENERIGAEILIGERNESLKKAEFRYQRQMEIYNKKLTDKDAVIADCTKINQDLKKSLFELQSHYQVEKQKWLTEQEKWIKKLRRLIHIASTSKRWRLGNAIGLFSRKIMLKGYTSTAMDELNQVVDEFQEWHRQIISGKKK